MYTPFGRSSVLFIGPTGSGKISLAQSSAKVLAVPFAMSGATAFTRAGWIRLKFVTGRLLISKHFRSWRGYMYIATSRELGPDPSIDRNRMSTKQTRLPDEQSVQVGETSVGKVSNGHTFE